MAREPRVPDDDHWRPSVGDGVRVRAGVGSSLFDCDEMAHAPEEAGGTGRVVADRAQPGTPHHAYLVLFDRPAPVVMLGGRATPLCARHYAAEHIRQAMERSASMLMNAIRFGEAVFGANQSLEGTIPNAAAGVRRS